MEQILEKIYINALNKNPDFIDKTNEYINSQIQLYATPNMNNNYLFSIANKQIDVSQAIDSRQLFTSRKLGDIAEESVQIFLEEVFGKNIVENISKIGHQGDLLINIANDFKVMIEIKNKNTIVSNDLKNFENASQKFNFSIFVSLHTDKIPSKGSFFYEDNKLYLTKDYVNKESFNCIKTFILKIYDNQRNSIKEEQNKTLILTFKHKIQKIISLVQSIKDKQNELQSLYTQLSSLSESYVLLVNEVDDNQLIQKQIKDMQEYCQKYSFNTVRKQDLVSMFPVLGLEKFTKQQIVDKYNIKFKTEIQNNIPNKTIEVIV